MHSDHVAKFCSDRPRDLGDLALKKNNKKTAVKQSLLGTTVPDSLKITQQESVSSMPNVKYRIQTPIANK